MEKTTARVYTQVLERERNFCSEVGLLGESQHRHKVVDSGNQLAKQM